MTTTARGEGLTREQVAALSLDSTRTYEVVDGALHISATGGLTRADRDDLPPVGSRQELVDGVVIVNAAPRVPHQIAVVSLTVLLDEACPPGMRVLSGPIDVVLADDGIVQPDLVVARRSDLTEKDLPVAPVLSIEVLSPSTRRIDLGRKRELLAAAGCPSYWVIDPGRGDGAPTLIVFELVDGEYAEVARVSGDESWTATRPFPVTIVPDALLDD